MDPILEKSLGKCIVFGCTNHKYEGQFVGDLCRPCHYVITTGDFSKMPTRGSIFDTMSHDLRMSNDKIEQIKLNLSRFSRRIVSEVLVDTAISIHDIKFKA